METEINIDLLLQQFAALQKRLKKAGAITPEENEILSHILATLSALIYGTN